MAEQLTLFDLGEIGPAQPVFKPFNHPVWTENKAKLVARYLFLFVMVTRHGLYIDGFAAPQEPDVTDSWAAKLAVETIPKQFLREFWLFDQDLQGIQRLRDLIALQPAKPKRRFTVVEGDFNLTYRQVLESGRVKPKTASFCLLDQRTLECHWNTVKALARHKAEGHKIELFYFLATGWLDRSLASLTVGRQRADDWWGNSGWDALIHMDGTRRALLMCDRFKDELGYKHVLPFPIYERGSAGKVMYHMIHASDHPEAPKFMARAYRTTTNTALPYEQLEMEFADFDKVQGEISVDLSGAPAGN